MMIKREVIRINVIKVNICILVWYSLMLISYLLKTLFLQEHVTAMAYSSNLHITVFSAHIIIWGFDI